MCRVLDYSKYKYEQAQKVKQARKHQQQITVREIKFRPKIAEHDYDTKKHHVERFLRHKDKVKVTIMFRGREVTHPERGTAILDRLAEELVRARRGRAAPDAGRAQHDDDDGALQSGAGGQGRRARRGARERGLSRAARGRRRRADVAARTAACAEAPPRRRSAPPRLLRRSAQPRTAPTARGRPRRSAVADGTSGERRRSPRDAAADARRVIITARDHAQDEDPLRREEALQGHRHRQGARPARLHEPHPREEVAQTQARARAARRCSPTTTRRASSGCWGSANDAGQALACTRARSAARRSS